MDGAPAAVATSGGQGRMYRAAGRLRRAGSRRLAILLILVAGSAGLPPASAADARPTPLVGQPLEAALLGLRARGLRIVFASNVVTPEMRVEAAPAATEPRALLDQLLAPHRLIAREGPGGTLVIVSRAPAPIDADPAAAASAPVPQLRYSEALVVTPSRISVLGDGAVGALGLDRGEMAALPHLGDDLFRSLSLLPGIAANDVSAAFHVRGGRRDETRIVLDGQELFDAYHLHDYDDAQSVVAPDALGGAELSTGGFGAAHGDRMSGVLDLRTSSASGATRFRLGAGILGLSATGSGALAGDRGSWLAGLRRGTFDVVGRLLGAEDPASSDGLGKVSLRLGSRATVRATLLRARDRLEFTELVDGESKRFSTDYANGHGWLALETLLGSEVLVETAAGLARIDRDRRGAESEEDGRFSIRDRRETTVRELRQSWGIAASAAHELEAGWLWRRYSTDYDYAMNLDSDDPLARLRPDGGRRNDRFRGRFDEEHFGVHLSDRVRLSAPVVLDLGVRLDRYREQPAARVSPRANLAWRLGARTVARAAWGRFDQSERTYEVEVEDGERARLPLERSEHRIVGFETRLGDGSAAQPPTLGVELYRRTVGDPHPRYENLFEPINTFPEIEPARVRIAPREARAQGVELALRGARGARLRWWIAYARATTEDNLDGRWTPRPFDQRQALSLDVDLALGAHWRLNLAWRAHTGWPTTPITLARQPGPEGELVPLLGPLNSDRLPPYHRLDLRASRSWRGPRALVDFYLDVQNLYDRQNVGGYDLAVDEATGALLAAEETWPGILFSAGVSVELGGGPKAP